MTPRELAHARHVAILAGIARQVYEQYRTSPVFGRKVYGLRFRGGHGTGIVRSGLPTTDDHPAPEASL